MLLTAFLVTLLSAPSPGTEKPLSALPTLPKEPNIDGELKDLSPAQDFQLPPAAKGPSSGLGLKAAGGDSVSLSNTGQGSVHCITMTYPKVPMADLLKSMGAKEIR